MLFAHLMSLSLIAGNTGHYPQEHTLDVPTSIATSEWAREMDTAFQAARQAGAALLHIQHAKEDLQIEQKTGKEGILSPVTLADTQANAIICSMLHQEFPDYGILTEEEVPDAHLQEALEQWRVREHTWIIDPLDGTKNFINGGIEYGIHIGLTENGKPVLGLNYYPETDTVYFAVKGYGSYKQIGSSPAQQFHIPAPSGTLLPLRNTDPKETAAVYEQLLERAITPSVVQEFFPIVDSCGLRICSIAEGTHNLYLSKGIRGGLWDYCSGEVILREAGGIISDLEGNDIDYRTTDGLLSHGSLVTNDKALQEKVLQILRELAHN